MIYSNVRTKEELHDYMNFLEVNFVHYWVLWTQGFYRVPVIGKKTIEQLFDIEISDNTICCMKPNPNSGFEPNCPISGAVNNKEQFIQIGHIYNLNGQEVFGHLLAAHDLFAYNNGLLQDICL